MKNTMLHKLLILSLVSVLLFVSGCGVDSAAESTPTVSATEAQDKPLLNLTVSASEGANPVFSLDETGGNFTQQVQYLNTDSVTVEIDGSIMKLEEALKDGYLTEEDIFYYARKDAKNGFCEQTVESNHGVSHFTFAYPEFNLRLIYDVFEAPDGEQHLISDMSIYIPYIDHIGYTLGAYTDFRDPETGVYLNREDWGLEFEVIEASSTGISLTCTQSGGQQIGALFIDGYEPGSEMFIVERLDGNPYVGEYTLDIQMEGSTEISIDWNDVYGELPGGEYQLNLHIFDKFTEDQVHPLMDDFHDWQVYTVPFTIS